MSPTLPSLNESVESQSQNQVQPLHQSSLVHGKDSEKAASSNGSKLSSLSPTTEAFKWPSAGDTDKLANRKAVAPTGLEDRLILELSETDDEVSDASDSEDSIESDLKSVDLPSPYDEYTPVPNEWDSDPAEIAKGRYKPITDTDLFIKALSNPELRSTSDLYDITANAADALKAYQDEYVSITKHISMASGDYDTAYAKADKPRVLIDADEHDIYHVRELHGEKVKGFPYKDLNTYDSNPTNSSILNPAADISAGRRSTRNRKSTINPNGEETSHEYSRATTTSLNATPAPPTTRGRKRKTAVDPGPSFPNLKKGEDAKPSDSTYNSDADDNDPFDTAGASKRRRIAPPPRTRTRRQLPPSKLVRQLSTDVKESSLETATRKSTPAANATTQSTAPSGPTTTAASQATKTPKSTTAPPKSKGRASSQKPNPLAPTTSGTRVSKLKFTRKATTSATTSSNPATAAATTAPTNTTTATATSPSDDPKPKNPKRSNAMTAVWAKRKAEGRNGRHGGPPLVKAKRGRVGRPRKDDGGEPDTTAAAAAVAGALGTVREEEEEKEEEEGEEEEGEEEGEEEAQLEEEVEMAKRRFDGGGAGGAGAGGGDGGAGAGAGAGTIAGMGTGPGITI